MCLTILLNEIEKFFPIKCRRSNSENLNSDPGAHTKTLIGDCSARISKVSLMRRALLLAWIVFPLPLYNCSPKLNRFYMRRHMQRYAQEAEDTEICTAVVFYYG